MAKGRWLKRQGRKLGRFVDNTVDTIVDEIADKIEDGDLGPAVQKINQVGKDCGRLARDTSALCTATEEKGGQMMAIGDALKATLESFGHGNMDASALETIKDLMDGDQLHEARTLATDITQHATECVSSSVEMIDLIEDSLDSLPPVIKNAMERAMEESDDEEEGADGEESAEDSEASLSRDIQEVEECITSIRELNLVSAMEVGLRVFRQLTSKAERSREMFASVRGFSDDVSALTKAFRDVKIGTFMKKFKDLWQCLKYTSVMKMIAEGVSRLMNVVIDLFTASASTLSGLWSALAFCKDCIFECGDHVKAARAIVQTAQTDALALVETTRSIQDQLDDLGDIDGVGDAKDAVVTIAKSGGKDIKKAIEIAERMDDQVVQCVSKTLTMVDKVTEGYHNLPPIVTDGFSEEEDGKVDDDAVPPDFSSDIEELRASREKIESSRFIGAIKESSRGVRRVARKSVNCQDMLDIVQEFVKQCMATIESFMGVWDLESATDKVREMLRLVNLGKLMKQFADQVKELLLAMIAMLKAAVNTFGDRVGDIKDKIEDRFEDVADKAKENLGNLRFWKK